VCEHASTPERESALIRSSRPSLAAWVLLFGIVVYRATLKRVLVARGVTCLHHPTCSEYARICLHKYRLVPAIRWSWERLRDCHPFSGRPYLDPP
jgi:putative component of membrane protein insertase Oxa1/YidC/SpoIIIJ protein YidD